MSPALIVMSLAYVAIGILHLIKPGLFIKIVPPFLPQPLLLVWISGLAEILLGCGLWIERYRSLAAWGVIALLIAVFPANIYMTYKGGAAYGMPTWLLWARLPIQFLLMAWAYRYT